MATLKQDIAELRKLKQMQSRFAPKVTKDRQLSTLEAVKQVAEASTPTSALGFVNRGVASVARAPSGIRRATLTGAGTAIGEAVGPVGAGAGAAVGGTLADIADASESPKLQEAVAESFKKFGFTKKLAQDLSLKAIQSMSKDDIVSFLKKRGGEFATGALLAGGAKKITKAVIKSSRREAAGAVKTGFADPALATKVGQKKAFRDLTNFERPILRKELLKNAEDVKKLRVQLGAPKGQLELVLSLETKFAAGTKVSNAELLLGREAARKVNKRGGSNGKLASRIFKKIALETEKRFPGASKKFKRVEKTVKAQAEEGDQPAKGIIGAISSLKGKGLLKLLVPSFGTKTGANLRKLLEASPTTGTALSSVILDAFSKRKGK